MSVEISKTNGSAVISVGLRNSWGEKGTRVFKLGNLGIKAYLQSKNRMNFNTSKCK